MTEGRWKRWEDFEGRVLTGLKQGMMPTDDQAVILSGLSERSALQDGWEHTGGQTSAPRSPQNPGKIRGQMGTEGFCTHMGPFRELGPNARNLPRVEGDQPKKPYIHAGKDAGGAPPPPQSPAPAAPTQHAPAASPLAAALANAGEAALRVACGWWSRRWAPPPALRTPSRRGRGRGGLRGRRLSVLRGAVLCCAVRPGPRGCEGGGTMEVGARRGRRRDSGAVSTAEGPACGAGALPGSGGGGRAAPGASQVNLLHRRAPPLPPPPRRRLRPRPLRACGLLGGAARVPPFWPGCRWRRAAWLAAHPSPSPAPRRPVCGLACAAHRVLPASRCPGAPRPPRPAASPRGGRGRVRVRVRLRAAGGRPDGCWRQIRPAGPTLSLEAAARQGAQSSSLPLVLTGHAISSWFGLSAVERRGEFLIIEKLCDRPGMNGAWHFLGCYWVE